MELRLPIKCTYTTVDSEESERDGKLTMAMERGGLRREREATKSWGR